MLGTSGGNRSQKSCGQISKPHESELNSQTPQLGGHVRLPRASQPPLGQAPAGARPSSALPPSRWRGGVGVRGEVGLLGGHLHPRWHPHSPSPGSPGLPVARPPTSLPARPDGPSPDTPSVLRVSTSRGSPQHLLFPLEL